MVEGPYGGWARNLILSNGEVEVVITLEVGPRIIRYARVGGPNRLGELASELGRSGETEWKLRGGHRLWVAPEDPDRTYAPDNGPVLHRSAGEGVLVESAPDERLGLARAIEIALAPRGSEVRLVHRIRNQSGRAQTLAPWALTVLAPGGVALVPLPPRGRHPGASARSPADFAPHLTMALWPYFRFDDPRLKLGSRFLRLCQDGAHSSTKLGLAHREGWVAYWNVGSLFVKRFGYEEGAAYPDGGCNFETYTDEQVLELESLGPMVSLGPGEETVHRETWYLFDGVPAPGSDHDLADSLPPLFGSR
jgi:hypothetical protein